MAIKIRRKPLPKTSLLAVCQQFGLNYNHVWQCAQLGEKPPISAEKKAEIKAWIQGRNEGLMAVFGIE